MYSEEMTLINRIVEMSIKSFGIILNFVEYKSTKYGVHVIRKLPVSQVSLILLQNDVGGWAGKRISCRMTAHRS